MTKEKHAITEISTVLALICVKVVFLFEVITQDIARHNLVFITDLQTHKFAYHRFIFYCQFGLMFYTLVRPKTRYWIRPSQDVVQYTHKAEKDIGFDC